MSYICLIMVELGIGGRQETTVTSANIATNAGIGKVKAFDERGLIGEGSEKYRDIYSDSEMHVVEGENHLIIKKRKEVIGIILDFLSNTLNQTCTK